MKAETTPATAGNDPLGMDVEGAAYTTRLYSPMKGEDGQPARKKAKVESSQHTMQTPAPKNDREDSPVERADPETQFRTDGRKPVYVDETTLNQQIAHASKGFGQIQVHTN